jgi:hypothetical protein
MIKYIVLIFIFIWSSKMVHSQSVAIAINQPQTSIYKTYYNKLQVVVENTFCDSLCISGAGIEVYKQSGCVFFIKLIDAHRTSIAYTVYNCNSSNIILSDYLTVSDTIPLPNVLIRGNAKGSVDNIITTQSDSVYCTAYFDDVYNNSVKFLIQSFEVILINDKGVICYQESIKGCLLTADTRAQINNMKKEDKLVLSNISVEDEFGNVYVINNKVFRP